MTRYRRRSVAHYPDNHTNAPTVNNAIISLRAVNDLGSHVYRGAVTCLKTAYSVRIRMNEMTRAGHTTCELARPKSATLTTGGLSSVRRMFSGFRFR